MLSYYHPGVFGNGEWTCCKKAKDGTGCRETTVIPKNSSPGECSTVVTVSHPVNRESEIHVAEKFQPTSYETASTASGNGTI